MRTLAVVEPVVFEVAEGITAIDTFYAGRERYTAAYLVHGDAPAIVETGPATSFEPVRAGLERLGIGPNDLAHIAVTHIHLDHAGGVWSVGRFALPVVCVRDATSWLFRAYLRVDRSRESAVRAATPLLIAAASLIGTLLAAIAIPDRDISKGLLALCILSDFICLTLLLPDFDGRTDEALAFYAKAVNAKVTALMRYKESPSQEYNPPGSAEKVMHCNFTIGNSQIMASDGDCKGQMKSDGFALAITAESTDQAEQMFNGLKEGGQVTLPLTQTFFAKSFGMLKDKFGVHWMIMAEK